MISSGANRNQTQEMPCFGPEHVNKKYVTLNCCVLLNSCNTSLGLPGLPGLDGLDGLKGQKGSAGAPGKE